MPAPLQIAFLIVLLLATPAACARPAPTIAPTPTPNAAELFSTDIFPPELFSQEWLDPMLKEYAEPFAPELVEYRDPKATYTILAPGTWILAEEGDPNFDSYAKFVAPTGQAYLPIYSFYTPERPPYDAGAEAEVLLEKYAENSVPGSFKIFQRPETGENRILVELAVAFPNECPQRGYNLYQAAGQHLFVVAALACQAGYSRYDALLREIVDSFGPTVPGTGAENAE